MKIAHVGLGYWGPKILRNLVEQAGISQVVAIDSDVRRLTNACLQYPDLQIGASLDEVLRDEEVRAVVIATPLDSHFDLAMAALDAGRHVMVEKPMAASAAEAVILAKRADELGLTLMAGHTFLFSPQIEFIARYLKAGRLGKIHYATSSRLNLGIHRKDASVIWDLAPHDFSILFHLLDEFPLTVQTSARGVNHTLPEVAFMTLTFPSEAIASVTVSWLAPMKVRHTVLVGEGQMMVYDDTRSDEAIKIYDKGVILDDQSVSDDSDSYAENRLTYRHGDTVSPYVSPAEPLARQVRHFLESIERGTLCRSDAWFGLRVVETLEAAHESWKSGGLPVAIERYEHETIVDLTESHAAGSILLPSR